MSSEQTLPERPAENTAPAEGGEGGEKLSKKALKKLEKEREKAEKKKAQQEKEAAAKAAADANDVSKGHYGETPIIGSAEWKPLSIPLRKLVTLADVADGTEVAVRCRVTNARSQSAKLAFLNLRDGHDSIQAVVAASDTLSRQMVKFASTIPAESVVDVVGLVKDAPVPVNSATISLKELHITQLWIVSKALPQLPIQVEDAELRIPTENAATEEVAASGRPLVQLATRLDNRVLDLRSTLNRAIMEIRDGVHILFEEYLRKHHFLKIDTPKLLGAPSEGGSNVFEVKYFDKKSYLAQSPQLYKQMLIAADYKRVFETAPVFRAENSNTSRHLTEYTSLDLEMEFESDYQDVIHFIRDLMFSILQGLQQRYQKQTERVRKEYKTEPFLLPASSSEIPILSFAEGVALLKETGVEVDPLDDIK
jgi:aspartyl-tRNA synthetase